MADFDLLAIFVVVALLALACRASHDREPMEREELARIRLLSDKIQQEEGAAFVSYRR